MWILSYGPKRVSCAPQSGLIRSSKKNLQDIKLYSILICRLDQMSCLPASNHAEQVKAGNDPKELLSIYAPCIVLLVVLSKAFGRKGPFCRHESSASEFDLLDRLTKAFFTEIQYSA